MNYKYEAVVIGAGPAGAACGITLQQKGVKHCLVDKSVFPRSKTCAGLVTGKTFRLIRSLFGDDYSDSLFCAVSSSVRLFDRTKLLVDAPITKSVRLVNRGEFDNALVERYRALGGELREGERGLKIDYENNRVILSNGDELSYNSLIFADGALSMSHKLLDVPRDRLAFGIEAYVPSSKLSTDSVDLCFGYLETGYVWIFPHGDTVCVGVADRFTRGEDYRAILSEVLSDAGVEPTEAKFIGAFLPYGYLIPQKKLPQNVLLTGDAGGFTDPISGEGLYMALQTGIYAGEAVSEKSPKAKYLGSVKPLEQIVKDGSKVQKLFYTPAIHEKLLGRINGNKKAVTFYFDNQVEEYKYTYRQTAKLYRGYEKSRGG